MSDVKTERTAELTLWLEVFRDGKWRSVRSFPPEMQLYEVKLDLSDLEEVAGLDCRLVKREVYTTTVITSVAL